MKLFKNIKIALFIILLSLTNIVYAETLKFGNSTYEGEVKKGKAHGEGIITFADFSKYEGKFKKNRIHGKGKFTDSDNNIFEGKFRRGKFVNKIDKKNISLSTPTANIAIRGTDFTCTVNELGESLIILLPDASGISSGEIIVTTMAGSVTLNKPYEATTATMFESAPSKPVILDLTLELIDNMLIVNPPKEDERFVEEVSQSGQASYLDFDDLDIDYLNEDFLEANELEFTELDINFLDVNFLEDLLNVLDALAVGEEEDQLAEATGINIAGTLIGKDPDTQITTLVTGQVISLRRSVSESVRLDLDGTGSYTIILIQDGVSNLVKINGGSDTTITIKQSS